MENWYNTGFCSDCACLPVCSVYSATGGGVTQCKYKIGRELYGEWIYAPCEDDKTVWVYHCSLCGGLSAREYPYCRECGAKMDMGVDEEN